MARKTKQQLIQEFQNFVTNDEVTDVDIRLAQLVKQQRITAGAAYYIHSSYSWYPVKQMEEYIFRAIKAKDYFQYLKNGWTLWKLNYYLEDTKKRHAAALKFVQEQEALPFELSQKQVLIKEGKLQQTE